jgi:cytochrome P450
VITEVLFSGLDTEWHDRQRRVVSSAFSMTQMVKYEPWVNDNIVLFIEELRKRFIAKEGLGASMDVMECMYPGEQKMSYSGLSHEQTLRIPSKRSNC